MFTKTKRRKKLTQPLLPLHARSNFTASVLSYRVINRTQMPQAAWKCIEYYFFLSLHFLWSEVLILGSPSASCCWWHQFQGRRGPGDGVTLTLPHGCYFLKWTIWKLSRGVWRLWVVFFSPLVLSSQVVRGSISWDWRCVFTWWELRRVRIDSANRRSLRRDTPCGHEHGPGWGSRLWNTHITRDMFYA